MPWSALASIGATVGGSLISSALSGDTAQTSAGTADPFGGQRPQYQSMLSGLMADPSSVKNLPGYQFNFEQGMQALERQQAAAGTLQSGQAETAAIRYGQDYATSTFNQWESILAQLAGGNIGSPGTAGQLYGQYQNQGNQAIQSGFGSIFSGLGNVITQPSIATGDQGGGFRFGG